MQLLPGFGDVQPPPPPPDPIPTVDSAALELEASRKKVRQSEKRRAGRAALNKTGGLEDEGLGNVTRPQARTSRLLGG